MTSAFYVRSLTNKKAKRTNQIFIRGVSMSSAAVFALHSFILPCYEKRTHVEEPGENHSDLNHGTSKSVEPIPRHRKALKFMIQK